MDILGNTQWIPYVLIVPVSMVCFWFISKKCSKWILPCLALGLWLIGKFAASAQIGGYTDIGRALRWSGFIGVVYGIIYASCAKGVKDEQEKD
jgi:hypothetical protein